MFSRLEKVNILAYEKAGFALTFYDLDCLAMMLHSRSPPVPV